MWCYCCVRKTVVQDLVQPKPNKRITFVNDLVSVNSVVPGPEPWAEQAVKKKVAV